MPGQFHMTNRLFFSHTILLGALCLGTSSVRAQDSTPATTAAVPALTPAAQSAASQGQESSEPQTLHLLVGRSLVITSPTRIKRISLADPAIAEAIVVSPNQVVLNGKAPGVVSFLLWDESEQNQIFEVTVDLDILQLSAKLKEAFPS